MTIRDVAGDASAAAARFPAPLLVSVACGVMWASAIRRGDLDQEPTWRAIATLTLGIPLAFALSVGAERHRLPAPFAWAATVVLLVAHYASLEWQTTTAFFYRTAELVLAAHLLVAFLPYLGSGSGFWSYNESLFTRAVTAVVFSAILFTGLAVGMLTVRYLLGLDVPPAAFGYLLVAVAFGFNTWFFLAGVPDPLSDTAPTEVPHALVVLTQRILMPRKPGGTRGHVRSWSDLRCYVSVPGLSGLSTNFPGLS